MTQNDSQSCPEWCTNHVTTEYTEGSLEQHTTDLWVGRLPDWLSTDEDSNRFRLWLFASATDLVGTELPDMSFPPALSLMDGAKGAAPRMINTDEAREIIAGLTRGIEIVEALLTACCAVCGRAVLPREADECVSCRGQRNIAASRHLAIVEEEV